MRNSVPSEQLAHPRKRLALYVFFEKKGVLHDYMEFYLKSLKEIAQDILVIANGRLSHESRDKLKNLDIDFLCRENKGFDFSAWRAGLEYKGWDTVRSYDELILCNCSCSGPIFPFSEMFSCMNERDCDFWGINRQPDKLEKYFIPGDPKSQMISHIQSYFYVFRNTAIISPAFSLWWSELKDSETYWQEVSHHEIQFTQYLEKYGLRSDTYMNFDKYNKLSPKGDANFHFADKQLIEDRNPLIKRKLIFTFSNISLNCIRFITNKSQYNELYIWNDICRTQHKSKFKIITYHLFAKIMIGKRRERYKQKSLKYALIKLYKQNKELIKSI